MLYPHEIFEYMISLGIILLALILSILLYLKKRKQIGFYITALILASTISFFIIRPFWIDSQIDKKSIILDSYLQAQYPDANWTISSQNFRKHKTVNPYYLLVDFSDEPNYTYYYYVYRSGEVEQMGGESGSDNVVRKK